MFTKSVTNGKDIYLIFFLILAVENLTMLQFFLLYSKYDFCAICSKTCLAAHKKQHPKIVQCIKKYNVFYLKNDSTMFYS